MAPCPWREQFRRFFLPAVWFVSRIRTSKFWSSATGCWPDLAVFTGCCPESILFSGWSPGIFARDMAARCGADAFLGRGHGILRSVAWQRNHTDQLSSKGNSSAIASPVKLATQPSGLLNSRIAVNTGFGPMSNQCFVSAGTEIRSSFSHSIE